MIFFISIIVLTGTTGFFVSQKIESIKKIIIFYIINYILALVLIVHSSYIQGVDYFSEIPFSMIVKILGINTALGLTCSIIARNFNIKKHILDED